MKGYDDGFVVWLGAPTARRLQACGKDWLIRLWDSNTGAEQGVLRGHGIGLISVCFSPDGTRLASAAGAWPDTPNRHPEVKLWDVAARRRDPLVRGNPRPCGRRRELLGRREAAGGGGHCRGRPRLGGRHRQADQGLRGGPLTVRNWGRVQSRWPAPGDHQRGRACGHLGCLQWRPSSYPERSHRSGLVGPASTPTAGAWRQARHDTTVRVWEFETGRSLLTLRGHHGVTCSVQFYRDWVQAALHGGRTE